MNEGKVSLSKSAQSVQKFMNERGFDFQVLELPSSTRTASDAAQTMCCEIGQIVKSLVFFRTVTRRPILILASGANKVDEIAIQNEIGEPISKADAAFVREVTGFSIGGIPPAGHKQKIETLIDSDLFQYGEL